MSAPPHRFSLSTEVGAPADAVWAHAISLQGVNRELSPLVRMTFPRKYARLTPETVELGRPLFRSWVLLFGVLPVDYDDLTLVEVEPGRRFLERSPMLTQREWVHERVVEPTAMGCRVSDSISFVPRLAVLGPLQLRIFRFAFRLRHRNLRRIFSPRANPGSPPLR